VGGGIHPPWIRHNSVSGTSLHLKRRDQQLQLSSIYFTLIPTSLKVETHQNIIVYALNFSKAFDSVRHSTLITKYSILNISDNIFNWIESFFRDHSGEESGIWIPRNNSQHHTGLRYWTSLNVVTASDLHPITPGNQMDKYAGDTHLIIPASNSITLRIEPSKATSL
jgi:hypothetical protein